MPDAEKDASPWPCVTHGVAGCEKCWPRVAPPADYDAWERVKADPEVVAAHAALDAHEAEEDRLTLELGRALRRARSRVTSPAGGRQSEAGR